MDRCLKGLVHDDEMIEQVMMDDELGAFPFGR
jgi:hypothetical protein